jgi:hypothetical protein
MSRFLRPIARSLGATPYNELRVARFGAPPMKSTAWKFALSGCLLFGGCVESSFELTRASPIPAGLKSDPEAVKATATATRIQLWLLLDKAELRFYEWDDLVLKRLGSGYRNARPGEGSNRFFVTFNGVESRFHQVILPSVVIVEDVDEK